VRIEQRFSALHVSHAHDKTKRIRAQEQLLLQTIANSLCFSFEKIFRDLFSISL